MCTTWGETEAGVNHLNIYAMEKAFQAYDAMQCVRALRIFGMWKSNGGL